MLTTGQLKVLLQAQGLRLTKRLGQHHLIDPGAIERVMAVCGPLRGRTVVEIGPGLGALTEPLLEQAGRVIAVELDRGIAALLSRRLGGRPNLEVRCEDILRFAWNTAEPVIVVGAIPYSVTSPILVSLCEARSAIERAVLIMQEEVAVRLAARPGTKAYGRLSVLVQYGWEVCVRLSVPRGAFFPPPRVESRCVELLSRRHPAVEVADEALFFEIVKAGFGQRRKTLTNTLSGLAEARGVPRRRLPPVFASAGLSGSARGETLSLEQFGALANALTRLPGARPDRP